MKSLRSKKLQRIVITVMAVLMLAGILAQSIGVAA